jgi:hypothetical protein
MLVSAEGFCSEHPVIKKLQGAPKIIQNCNGMSLINFWDAIAVSDNSLRIAYIDRADILGHSEFAQATH